MNSNFPIKQHLKFVGEKYLKDSGVKNPNFPEDVPKAQELLRRKEVAPKTLPCTVAGPPMILWCGIEMVVTATTYIFAEMLCGCRVVSRDTVYLYYKDESEVMNSVTSFLVKQQYRNKGD